MFRSPIAASPACITLSPWAGALPGHPPPGGRTCPAPNSALGRIAGQRGKDPPGRFPPTGPLGTPEPVAWPGSSRGGWVALPADCPEAAGNTSRPLSVSGMPGRLSCLQHPAFSPKASAEKPEMPGTCSATAEGKWGGGGQEGENDEKPPSAWSPSQLQGPPLRQQFCCCWTASLAPLSGRRPAESRARLLFYAGNGALSPHAQEPLWLRHSLFSNVQRFRTAASVSRDGMGEALVPGDYRADTKTAG